MVRIAGVNIPEEKRIEASLQYIYGVGSTKAKEILLVAKVNPDTRTINLSKEEVTRLKKALDQYPTEGDLRRMVLEDVKRLKEIGCYRGIRHAQGLPVHGQRTRSNARTKRGRRRTIGAVSKRMSQRMVKTAQVKGKTGKEG
jgi:small subunit ribosomal protein S13